MQPTKLDLLLDVTANLEDVNSLFQNVLQHPIVELQDMHQVKDVLKKVNVNHQTNVLFLNVMHKLDHVHSKLEFVMTETHVLLILATLLLENVYLLQNIVHLQLKELLEAVILQTENVFIDQDVLKTLIVMIIIQTLLIFANLMDVFIPQLTQLKE